MVDHCFKNNQKKKSYIGATWGPQLSPNMENMDTNSSLLLLREVNNSKASPGIETLKLEQLDFQLSPAYST